MLVDEAKKRGCTIVSAEDWLLNQAVASYKLFLGSEPDKEVMRSGLRLPTLSQKNHVLATIGIMGAGKTSHGKVLAEKLNYQFKDIDKEIVLREGMPITQIFSEKGEPYFRELERDTLQKTFSPDTQNILSCGGGIVVNEPNRTLLKENALVLWLYATPEAIIKRVNISKRPLLQCENPQEKLRQLLVERKDMYVNTAHVVFSTEKRTKYESTDILKNEIEKIWGHK